MDEQNNQVALKKILPLFQKLALWTTIGLTALLPVIFIPSSNAPFFFGKHLILWLAVFILGILWLLERIQQKNFMISKNLLVWSALAVPVAYLLSALFSGTIKTALLGESFETGVFAVIALLFLLMFFVSRVFQSRKNILYLYAGLFVSFVVLAIFHLTRLFFGPEIFSMGMLTTATASVFGSWSELGIFFGLIATLALTTLEFLGKNKRVKILGYIVLAISLFLVAVVNFSLVWIILAILSFLMLLYNLQLNKLASSESDNTKTFPILPLIIFLVSVLFISAKAPVGGFLPSLFNIANQEVRLTTGGTWEIAKASLTQNPILGAGPNKFASQWVANKPAGINATQFWNSDFNSGSSSFLTALTTIGLLGFLAWILFLASVLYFGFRLVKFSHKNQFDQYIALSLVSATFYLLFFFVAYTPNIAVLGLLFLFLGALMSVLLKEKLIKIIEISFNQNKMRQGLFIVIGLVMLEVLLHGGYYFTKKALASVQFQKGIVVLNTENDLGQAIELLNKATQNYPTDTYYRGLAELFLIQLRAVVSQADIEEEVLQQQFQAVFGNALTATQLALTEDQMDYQNWSALAKVWASVVSLGVEQAYENATQAYSNAIALNPNSPLLALSLANLELAQGNLEKGKEYAGVAIQMKNDYADAYYLLSQLELNNDNAGGAVQILEALANVSQNDPQVFFNLGMLHYNLKNNAQATPILERAVILNPYFTDAKYLLGLNYSVLGEKEKAVAQFEDLVMLNPQDTTLPAILDNLQNDREPFYGLQQQSAPAEPEMEMILDEEDLPIEEEINAEVADEEDEE